MGFGDFRSCDCRAFPCSLYVFVLDWVRGSTEEVGGFLFNGFLAV